MKIDKILVLVFFALLVVAVICMGNGAVAGGFGLVVVAIIEGFVAYRVWVSMVLRHDVMEISNKYSQEEILRTAQEAFVAAKWKSAVGPGQLNFMWSKLGGIIAGPVLSVAIQNKFDNACEIDVWVSNYSTEKTAHLNMRVKLQK